MDKTILRRDPERINLNIDPKLKKKAKIAAVRKNQTLTEFITSLLEDKLNKNLQL